MKTSEFKKEIEALPLKVEVNEASVEEAANITIRENLSAFKQVVAGVCEDTSLSITTAEKAFDELPSDLRETLFNILVEYAKTPIEERVDELRFKVHLIAGYYGYLNQLDTERLSINGSPDEPGYRTIFTESEYEKLTDMNPGLPVFDRDNYSSDVFEIVGD